MLVSLTGWVFLSSPQPTRKAIPASIRISFFITSISQENIGLSVAQTTGVKHFAVLHAGHLLEDKPVAAGRGGIANAGCTDSQGTDRPVTKGKVDDLGVTAGEIVPTTVGSTSTTAWGQTEFGAK